MKLKKIYPRVWNRNRTWVLKIEYISNLMAIRDLCSQYDEYRNWYKKRFNDPAYDGWGAGGKL